MATKKILTDIDVDGDVTADSIIKSGGTSAQYLMADGSTTTGGSSANNSLVTVNTATGLDGATTFTLNQASAVDIDLALDLSELPQSQEPFELIGLKSDGTEIKILERNYMAAKGSTQIITGNGSQNNFTLTHDLLGWDLVVNIWDDKSTSPYYRQKVQARVEVVNSNNIKVTFKKSVPSGYIYKVEILRVTQYVL